MSRLKASCKNGFGQDCYDYAIYLRDIARDRDTKKIERFIHRACVLTYQPACGHASKPERIGSTKSRACSPTSLKSTSFGPITMPGNVAGLQIIRMESASPFARAGLRLGDVVLRANGRTVSAAAELTAALNDGPVMVELRRGAALTTLSVSCR